MKAASINELKQELAGLPPKKLLELCLRMARFKKENKELLSFLLFEADDEDSYIASIKNEMDEHFADLPKSNSYLAKKALRKILKSVNKYSKHTAKKESEVEMLLHFCSNVRKSGIAFRSYKALSGLYNQQIKKLNGLVELVHEDLRFDYKKQLEKLY